MEGVWPCAQANQHMAPPRGVPLLHRPAAHPLGASPVGLGALDRPEGPHLPRGSAGCHRLATPAAPPQMACHPTSRAQAAMTRCPVAVRRASGRYSTSAPPREDGVPERLPRVAVPGCGRTSLCHAGAHHRTQRVSCAPEAGGRRGSPGSMGANGQHPPTPAGVAATHRSRSPPGVGGKRFGRGGAFEPLS